MSVERTRGRTGWRAGLVGALLAAALGGPGCASEPPPKEPDPVPFDDDPAGTDPGQGAVAPASSAKVDAGMKAIEARDFAEAKRVLAEAHADDPKDPQAAYYLGVALEGLGEIDAAAEKYRAALDLDPRLAEAAVNLSAILLEKQDARGALAVIDGALPAAPKHPALLLNRALALEASGDPGRATEAYGAAVAASPEDAELRFGYAELLARGDRKSDAVAELKRVAASGDAKVLAAVADLFGKLGVPAECVAALDKAIGAGATPALHVRRGVCRHEMKDDPGAEKDYLRAIELDAKFAAAHYYLGKHYAAQKKKKEARAAYRKAVEHGKGTPVAAKAEKELAELK